MLLVLLLQDFAYSNNWGGVQSMTHHLALCNLHRKRGGLPINLIRQGGWVNLAFNSIISSEFLS
jgi:hypothetical protein